MKEGAREIQYETYLLQAEHLVLEDDGFRDTFIDIKPPLPFPEKRFLITAMRPRRRLDLHNAT